MKLKIVLLFVYATELQHISNFIIHIKTFTKIIFERRQSINFDILLKFYWEKFIEIEFSVHQIMNHDDYDAEVRVFHFDVKFIL